MEIKLKYPKKEFEKELNKYIKEGENLTRIYTLTLTCEKFKLIKRDYDFWKEEVSDFLKYRFTNSTENKFLKSFNKNDEYIKNLAKVILGADISTIQAKYKTLEDECIEKLNVLLLLKRKLKFITVKKSNSIRVNKEMKNKIFISHSSLDAKYVEKIIDILEIIGVPSDKIFCSSFEGYGVKLGRDFLEVLKEELNNQVLVIFILSKNFYSSPISLCEMGATWVKTSTHIPILIPPFGYKDVKGVFPTSLGMKINEKGKFNEFKNEIEKFINLKSISFSIWERKRDNVLKEINIISKLSPTVKNSKTAIKNKSTKDTYYDNLDVIIKKNSKKEWKGDFEMQLHYITTQQSAVKELINHKPLDIEKSDFERIRKDGRKEWETNFEMQLHYEKNQIESLRKLNNI